MNVNWLTFILLLLSCFSMNIRLDRLILTSILFSMSYMYVPCATPDGDYVVQMILDNVSTAKMLALVTLVFWLHILLQFGRIFCSNIYFIPYNVSLNTLPKRKQNEYFVSLATIQAYLIFTIFLNLEDKSSILLFFNNDWFMLNTILFQVVLSISWVHLFFLNSFIFAVQSIIRFIFIFFVPVGTFV